LYQKKYDSFLGATSFNMMALSTMTLSITTINTKQLKIMTLSITIQNATLSINGTQNHTQRHVIIVNVVNAVLYYLLLMLSAIMLNVVMLNAVRLFSFSSTQTYHERTAE
jgi:hypothetical protein